MRLDALAALSVENEEYILDVPFTASEVEGAVSSLKGRKAGGPGVSLVGA